MSGPSAHRRAVVLVGGPAAPYSRGLRMARALDEAGFAVEIAAVAGEGLPEREMDGRIAIRRYAPSGPFRVMAPTYRERDASALRVSRPTRRFGIGLRDRVAAVRRWLFWPHTVRGWWATLRSSLEPAELYHACGSLAVAPALAARDRDALDGRTSVVVYDAIDDVVGSNNVHEMPTLVRRRVATLERAWARRSDARITVNDALAAGLADRWGLAEPPLVIPNWPEVPGTGDPPPDDRIRARLGLPVSTRIVLFQGRLGPDLGIDEAAEAVLRVPDAALVLLGFGRWMDRCRARDDEPRFAGRHFTLPAVHPDELLAWTRSADVALVPLPPVSDNQRSSTPNKFWEAIAAGTPVVVGPGLPVMDELVTGLDLGVVAVSLAPEALAAAIRQVVDASPAVSAERRRRIVSIARERFSWPVAADRYRSLVASLPGARPPARDR